MTNISLSSKKLNNSNTSVKFFLTSGEAHIYRIPVNAFPGLWGNVYAVLVEDFRVLIDCGSGYGDSNTHLEQGLKQASDLAGVDLTLPSLTHVLITHGHIDHFGGLSFLRPRTTALIGIHELDQRVVTNHEERLIIVARRLEEFLSDAGVRVENRGPILDMYKITKVFYQSIPIDFTYEALGMRLGPFEMLHVPGHCPGHVVIRLHDVLFSGDHVLDEISPHQAPERLTPSTGLDHYLRSLDILESWSTDVRLTFGGHGNPITDLSGRLSSIRAIHMERLQKVRDYLIQPLTIAQVSMKLFGEVNGYNILLALEETGAHVEYLYQRGLLRIDNLDEIDRGNNSTPIRYRSVD